MLNRLYDIISAEAPPSHGDQSHEDGGPVWRQVGRHLGDISAEMSWPRLQMNTWMDPEAELSRFPPGDPVLGQNHPDKGHVILPETPPPGGQS